MERQLAQGWQGQAFEKGTGALKLPTRAEMRGEYRVVVEAKGSDLARRHTGEVHKWLDGLRSA